MTTESRPIERAAAPAAMNTECRSCGKPIRKGRDYICYVTGWQLHVACFKARES